MLSPSLIPPLNVIAGLVDNASRVATEHDGAWHDRAGFLARVRQQTPVTGAAWRLVSVQNTLLQDGVAVQAHTGPAPGHWSALRAAHCGAMSFGSGPAPHAPWSGQDPGGDDLAVLRMLNENYVQAFRQADVAWYDAHLAPDYVAVSGSGLFQDRGAALADFAKPYFATSIASFPLGKVNIRRFADVALVHAENDYQLKDGRAGVSRYTDIWHKHQGRWRCVAAHITVHKAVHKAPAM